MNQVLQEREAENAVKPICQTLGMEHSLYALIGRVSQTLQASGLEDRAKEFVHRSMPVDNYDEMLELSQHYVEWKDEKDSGNSD